MLRGGPIRPLLLVAVCSLFVQVGCNREERVPSDLAAEIHSLARDTVRPGDVLESDPVIVKQDTSIVADWLVRDSEDTKQYFQWVKDRLKQQYSVRSEDRSLLVMYKYTSGDSYLLEFRDSTRRTGSDPEINVHFVAMAD